MRPPTLLPPLPTRLVCRRRRYRRRLLSQRSSRIFRMLGMRISRMRSRCRQNLRSRFALIDSMTCTLAYTVRSQRISRLSS